MRDRRCPCHSRRRYHRCCGPVHEGRAAPTAEALMRSRYAAYAMGLVAHLQRTTHADSPHRQDDLAAWGEELATFCRKTRFVGLRILDTSGDEHEALVRFHAELAQGDRDVSFEEHSRFLRVDGHWQYVAAT